MIINSDLLEAGVTMLTEYLQKGIVEVKFTKKDGTERVMNCTKALNLIPIDKHPKDKVQVMDDMMVSESKPTPTRERPLQLLTVFDIDKQDWRSFNYTTIKSIKLQD